MGLTSSWVGAAAYTQQPTASQASSTPLRGAESRSLALCSFLSPCRLPASSSVATDPRLVYFQMHARNSYPLCYFPATPCSFSAPYTISVPLQFPAFADRVLFLYPAVYLVLFAGLQDEPHPAAGEFLAQPPELFPFDQTQCSMNPLFYVRPSAIPFAQVIHMALKSISTELLKNADAKEPFFKFVSQASLDR